jgi:hypothetical protein
MPLKIYCAHQSPESSEQQQEKELAHSVFKGVRNVATRLTSDGDELGVHFHDVGMNNGFAVANDENKSTALATTGAGPCLIVVMHVAKGHGALAHFSEASAKSLKGGIEQMRKALYNQRIKNVVFAAGTASLDSKMQEELTRYVSGFVSPKLKVNMITGHVVETERVVWVGHKWSSCYYLPKEQEVAFFEASAGTIVGHHEGKLEKITTHTYVAKHKKESESKYRPLGS